MDRELLKEIIDCLPKERTLFRYFKDRYALILLEYFIGKGKKIKQVRQSAMAGLLEKPVLKKALAQFGNGMLTPEQINHLWTDEVRHFVLTVGHWNLCRSRYNQTTRKSANLVLQLNFSNEHDSVYRKMVKPESEMLLNHWGHPALKPQQRAYYRETLAWSRIDLDFDSNEALIEEIQTDWLREARRMLSAARAVRRRQGDNIWWWDVDGNVDDIIAYCENVLEPYMRMWDEAMLAATITFIRDELGIENIFYHTERTGYQLKRIGQRRPPRSLYTQLPKRFCFNRVEQAPEFLLQDRYFRRVYRKVNNPEWFYMKL